MPSPLCQIKDGAGLYTSTTNGKDVTPAATVTIALIAPAGVRSWSLVCISTDDLSDAAAVTASLTMNATTKVATYPAPVMGRAHLFESVVEGGVDLNGIVQPSYRTTFGVFTPISGRRVHSSMETYESHAVFGYTADLNAIIRNPSVTPPGDITVGPPGAIATFSTDGVADDVEINLATASRAAAGGGVVELLAGTYVLAASIVVPSNVTLRGGGAGVTKLVVGLGMTADAVSVVGSKSATSIALTADALPGPNTIAVTAGAEWDAVAVGDVLYLTSNAVWDVTSLTGRVTGEYVRVAGKSGTTLTLYGMARDIYRVSDSARLHRMSLVENVVIEGLDITQAGAAGSRNGANDAVEVSFARNVRVSNCHIHNLDGPGIVYSNVLDGAISGNVIRDLHDDTSVAMYGYGILIAGASENLAIHGNRISRCRHAIATGSGTGGVTRGCAVTTNVGMECTNTVFETHGEAEGFLYEGNHASNSRSWGIYNRSRSTRIIGNTIEWCPYGISSGSSTFDASSGQGAGSQIIGNVVRHIKALTLGGTCLGIALALTDNCVVQGNAVSAVDGAGLRLQFGTQRCIIRHNTFVDCNLSAQTGSFSDAVVFDATFSGTFGSLTFAAGVVTLSNTSTISNVVVGKKVVVTGAATPANNGTFVITGAPTANSLTYANASGVTDASNGAINWVIESSVENVFEGNLARNTAASLTERDTVGAARYMFRDLSLTKAGNVRNIFKNNTGIDMVVGLLSLHATNYLAGNSTNETTPLKVKAGAVVDADFLAVPAVGTLAHDTTNGELYVRGNAAWEVVGGPVRSLAADFTTSSIAAVATNLTLPVAANDILLIEWGGSWTGNSSSSGLQFSLGAPSGSVIEGGLFANSLTTPILSRIAGTGLSATLNKAAATTPFVGSARVKVGATAGNIVMQFASNDGVSLVTVKAGTWIRSTRVVEL